MKQLLSRQIPRSWVRHARRPSAPKPSAVAACGAGLDLAVEKVREAGGPMDHAAYGCQCGFRFSASVSTTVSCPHCGAAQAW